jgi:hypothetical protein
MNPLQAVRSPDHSLLCSPIGLQVVDSFLGAMPLAAYRAAVDVAVGNAWLETPLKPVRTPSGMLTLPGLGRRRDPAGNPAQQRYRVRVDSGEYIPEYRRTADGFEFLVSPYDESNALPIASTTVGVLALNPSPNYLYPGGVRVIHGRVRETNLSPARDAVIEFQGLDRAMTDERGEFAFGLRRAPASGPVVIDVHHDRTGRSQSFTLQLPAALRANQDLTLV